MNKRLLISESRGNLNRCTPYRGNLMHTTHILLAPVHMHHSYAFHGLSPYVTTFHGDPIELDGCTAPKKKCSRLHLSVWLSGPWDLSQFLSQHNHWSSAIKPHICWQTTYIDLLGPYHQHVISMFKTWSWGPTHQSLTNTGGGYMSHPKISKFGMWLKFARI
jgi:hypothetical protein